MRYILEGSVRKAGDRVRITAQLIDSTTGGHLWAERFDRQLTDIFAVQDDVADHIVSALALNLSPGDRTTRRPWILTIQRLTIASCAGANLVRWTKESDLSPNGCCVALWNSTRSSCPPSPFLPRPKRG